MCSSEGDALGGVDRHGVAEANQQPPGRLVLEPAPFHLADTAVFVAENEAVGHAADHLHDVAVVADRAAVPLDPGPGSPEQPQLVAGGDRNGILLAALIDRVVDAFVVAEFAACLHAVTDGPAEIGAVDVCQGGDGDGALGSGGDKGVAPLHVEIGDPADDLVLVTTDEPSGAISPLQRERLAHLPQMMVLQILGVEFRARVGDSRSVDPAAAPFGGSIGH